MEIRAVSQTTPQNNITHFVGADKQKNKQTTPHSAPIYKAVPLAVMIAMSPLGMNATEKTPLENENTIELSAVPNTNQVRQGGRIISTKRMDCFSQPADINLIDKNGKKSLQVVYHTMTGDVVANTVKIAQYNYSLTSDDGNSKSFTIRRPLTFTDEELSKNPTSPDAIIPPERAFRDYIEQMQKEYPDAVETVKYTRKLSTTPNGSLRNVGTSDLMKNAVASASYGKKLWSGDIKAESGNFTIRFYLNDGNDGNVETLTVQEEGYPELKLQNALFFKQRLFHDSEYPQVIEFGQVQLRDAKNNSFRIIDTKLAGTINSLKEQLQEQDAFNKAFFTMSLKQDYLVTTEGIVSKVD